jgi:hypothetical protein
MRQSNHRRDTVQAKTPFEKLRDNAAIIISLFAAVGTGVNAWVNYQARAEAPRLEYHYFSGHYGGDPTSEAKLYCSITNTGQAAAREVCIVCNIPAPEPKLAILDYEAEALKTSDGFYIVKVKTIPPGHTCRFELRSEVPSEALFDLDHSDVKKVYASSVNGIYKHPKNFFFPPPLRDPDCS